MRISFPLKLEGKGEKGGVKGIAGESFFLRGVEKARTAFGFLGGRVKGLMGGGQLISSKTQSTMEVGLFGRWGPCRKRDTSRKKGGGEAGVSKIRNNNKQTSGGCEEFFFGMWMIIKRWRGGNREPEEGG